MKMSANQQIASHVRSPLGPPIFQESSIVLLPLRRSLISYSGKSIMGFKLTFSSIRVRICGCDTVCTFSSKEFPSRKRKVKARWLCDRLVSWRIRASRADLECAESADMAPVNVCRALSDVRGSPFITRETAAVETPASAIYFTVEAFIRSLANRLSPGCQANPGELSGEFRRLARW